MEDRCTHWERSLCQTECTIISVMVLFCIKGVTILESSGDVVAHPACLWVGFLWLWSIWSVFCVICTCAYTSSVYSSTMQQNIRVTLITHFSHPNKASLTLRVPYHIYPAGFAFFSISLFLSYLTYFIALSLFSCYSGFSSLSLVLFNFYFFYSAEGAAPGEHYFQKASSCIIVRIHALISWTIWQTAYAPSSLNALHLLIKWMSHCFQSNTLNLCASLYLGLLSQTRFFMLQRLYWLFKWKINVTHLPQDLKGFFHLLNHYWIPMLMQSSMCNSEKQYCNY